MKRLVSSSRFVLFSLVGIVLIVFGVWIWDGGRSVVHEPVHGTKDVDVMKLEDRIGSSEGLESELSATAPKSKHAAVENREETEMMMEDHSAHVKRSQKMSQGDAAKQTKMTEDNMEEKPSDSRMNPSLRMKPSERIKILKNQKRLLLM